MYIHLIPIFLADPMFKKFACSSLSCFITHGFQHGLFSTSDAMFLWYLIFLPGIIQPNQPPVALLTLKWVVPLFQVHLVYRWDPCGIRR